MSTMWKVWNRNAIGVTEHHTIEGIAYPLTAQGEGTPVPMEHALYFLRDPAFLVQDEEGNVVERSRESKRPEIEVGPTEVVARLDELTGSALTERYRKAYAKQPAEVDREYLIRELVKAKATARRERPKEPPKAPVQETKPEPIDVTDEVSGGGDEAFDMEAVEADEEAMLDEINQAPVTEAPPKKRRGRPPKQAAA